VRFVGALAGVLLIVAAGVGIGVQAARTPNAPSPQAVSVADGVELGRSGARVSIELYEDPLCANCKTFNDTAGPQLQAWINSSTASVKYHVVSYLNSQSPTQYPSRAAAAMYCAADAGRFGEYHDIVFGDQPTPGADITDDELIADGPRAGITGPQQDAFAQCVKSKKYADFVSQISEQASQDGILATPTLFVDGKPVQNVSLAGVTAAVNAAL
jgi:protein-disulfide isomerase